jgi:hypothetical protein
MRAHLLTACVLLSCLGCSGRYVLTVPDQLAPAGASAVAVVRLQRIELFKYSPGVDQAAMRFRIAGLQERGAYTDKNGYAGTTVPVPENPGIYEMTVSHMDREGEEVEGVAPVYVWKPDAPIVAVDYDSLARGMDPSAEDCIAALKKMAARSNLIYLTQSPVAEHGRIHARLAKEGFPDGPVLLWEREQWHIAYQGQTNMPYVVVEMRLVNQISELHKVFPKLTSGVCGAPLAAKTFADAGLDTILVGKSLPESPKITSVQSWRELLDKGK